MRKKTKIVATIGPATETASVIAELIEKGVDIFRFNLKHNTTEWHEKTIEEVNRQAQKAGVNIGIMVDTPKIEKNRLFELADFVALSYLKDKKDVISLQKILDKDKIRAKIVAKIENKKALENLERIIDVADAVMIARGDLGLEIRIRELAFWQKKIIEMCRIHNIPVIVATQMLQSMVDSPKPTRAEATDVANAVFDGADALMLSEETAIGRYPQRAVEEMVEIASFCEKQTEFLSRIDKAAESPTELLVECVANIVTTKKKSKISKIVVFTQSGSTARMLSAYRLEIPIVAISDERAIVESLNISFGVIPFFREFDESKFDIEGPIFKELIQKNYLKTGENVIVIHGNNWLSSGSNSNVSIIQI